MTADLFQRATLPRAFNGWLSAASVSAFGDAIFYFALGWAATGIGPEWAGLVLTAITLPRAALLLLGGATGDRWGVRPVMIVSDAVMCLLTVLLAVLAYGWGVTPVLLVTVGLAIGVVGAFYLPATGCIPRLFVPDHQVPRALSLRQSAFQIVGLLAAPAGGVLVAYGGLVVVAALDAVTFAVVLAVLVVVRPTYPIPPPAVRTSVLQDAMGGVRVVLADRRLGVLLSATGLVAAFVLPMTSLCVPLLVRDRGWTSSTAGLIAGASACGALAVSLMVARRGTFSRPGLATGVGPLIAGLGMAGVAAGTTMSFGVVAALVQGVGVGLFVSHMAPLVMASTPGTHLARVQSLLGFVQTVPLLVANNLIAALAGYAGAAPAALACAVGTAAAGLGLLTSTSLREAHLPA